MPILVMCSNPQCGELFDAPDAAAGGTVICPACGASQPVGSAPPGMTGPSAAPPAGTAEPAAPPSAPPSAKPSPPPAPPPPAASARPMAPEQDEVDFEILEEPSLLQRPREAPPPAARATAKPPPSPRPPAPRPPAKTPPPPQPAGRSAAAQAPAGQVPTGPVQTPPAAETPPRAGRPRPAATQDYQTVEEAKPRADAELDAIFASPADRAGLPEAPRVSPELAVLEYKPAGAVIFLLSLLAMAAGAVAGWRWFPVHPILAAYLGAAAGWAGGFVLGMMMVLAVDRPDSDRIRCAVCRNLCPADDLLCRWCGSPLSRQAVDPLAAGCLWAWQYALGNLRAVTVLALGVLGAYLLTAAGKVTLAEWPRERAGLQPLFIALGGALAFWVFGYWMEYFLSAAAGTFERSDQAPDPPSPLSLASLASGAKVLAAAVVYVAPVVGLGLLPLGLLIVAVPRIRGAYSPARTARIAWAHLKDFLVLWLMLMLWTAAGAVAVVVIFVLRGLAAGLLARTGASPLAISVPVGAVAAVLLAVVASLYGLLVARCVGLFARLNARTLLSAQPPS